MFSSPFDWASKSTKKHPLWIVDSSYILFTSCREIQSSCQKYDLITSQKQVLCQPSCQVISSLIPIIPIRSLSVSTEKKNIRRIDLTLQGSIFSQGFHWARGWDVDAPAFLMSFFDNFTSYMALDSCLFYYKTTKYSSPVEMCSWFK